MYDIIGDLHGHADELVRLLESLDYQLRGGVYRHAERIAVFCGDFIDRGPEIRRVLQIVRAMLGAGSAYAVMGNHEFNAIAFHTPHPDRPGEFLRPHSNKNLRQHAATLAQLDRKGELTDAVGWFRTLPLWLELDGIRVVHACWDEGAIETIRQARRVHGGITSEFMLEATTPGRELFLAIEDVLKGKELDLPAEATYLDKDGQPRRRIRVQWYRAPGGLTFREFALPPTENLPEELRVPEPVDHIRPYPPGDPPVFFGHYWLRATHPQPLGSNVACVDFSVAKGGQLCAYRWQGEQVLTAAHFVTVPVRVH